MKVKLIIAVCARSEFYDFHLLEWSCVRKVLENDLQDLHHFDNPHQTSSNPGGGHVLVNSRKGKEAPPLVLLACVVLVRYEHRRLNVCS